MSTKDARVINCKRGTITVTEEPAAWIIVGEHKTVCHRGKPLTLRMRISRCWCAGRRGGREPKLCQCALRPKERYQAGVTGCHNFRKGTCHRIGHAEAIEAYVKCLAETYR